MDKMRILVHDFEKYRDNFALWGIICVNMRDQYFPDEQWRDATSSILQMWVPNITRLVNGVTDKCTLYFMDGDYRIELLILQRGRVYVECIASGKSVLIESTVDLFHFARQILSAVERMKIYYSEYLDSRTFQELTYETTQLRNALLKNS